MAGPGHQWAEGGALWNALAPAAVATVSLPKPAVHKPWLSGVYIILTLRQALQYKFPGYQLATSFLGNYHLFFSIQIVLFNILHSVRFPWSMLKQFCFQNFVILLKF
jgi:hypothetical protein